MDKYQVVINTKLIPCPTCYADAGQFCMKSKVNVRDAPHAARVRAALEQTYMTRVR